MNPTRMTTLSAAFVLLSAASATAAPAYVASTVNLRSAAGTSNEIVAKIPGGSLVEANNCTDWCEVEWQGKRGFAIATALDRSGRVPTRNTRPLPAAGAPAAVYEDDGYVPVAPPVVYGAPYYYGGYRPYYRGYGPRYGYGYRRGYRRW